MHKGTSTRCTELADQRAHVIAGTNRMQRRRQLRELGSRRLSETRRREKENYRFPGCERLPMLDLSREIGANISKERWI